MERVFQVTSFRAWWRPKRPIAQASYAHPPTSNADYAYTENEKGVSCLIAFDQHGPPHNSPALLSPGTSSKFCVGLVASTFPVERSA